MKTENDSTVHHNPYEDGFGFFITDKWKKKYRFRISSFPVPAGLLSVAVEVLDNAVHNEPYMFSLASPFNADVEHSEMRLKANSRNT